MWDSYSDVCGTQYDAFGPGDPLYLCGSGFTPGNLYDIAVYDADDNRTCNLDGLAANASGWVVTSSCLTDSGTQGAWHSQVFSNDGGSPVSYDANDINEIAEDLSAGDSAFFVGVPEFGFMLIPLFMAGMIYMSLRRKFLGISE